MSNTVDKRVVELELDNSNFERNAKHSQKTINEFKDSLDMGVVSKSLDVASSKFSLFEIVAITAISNITNKVINLGEQLVKSLSVDNISTGWSKFNEKTKSVATMASQTLKIAGKEITNYSEKMEIINQQLDKLNWYTDETSYNFTDMANNISKFTAAGVDLDTSVEAMMGIANWAALSGQNATTASMAMYQLSQAIGQGTVKLQDWKSVENANMATTEFKETALETAVALGKLTKQGNDFIDKTGKKFNSNDFRSSLSSGWLTSEVLTTTLSKYSEAVDKIYEISQETGLTSSQVMARYGSELSQFGVKAFKAAQEARTFSDAINAIKDAVSTGWMNTAENIFGGYDESKDLWSDFANELYEVFAAGGNYRNDILKIWSDLEGRADLFKHDPNNPDKQGAFWNLFDSIVAVVNTVKSAWREIFPKTAFGGYDDQIKDVAGNLKSLTERLQQWSARLKVSITENEDLKNVLKGVFTMIRAAATAFLALKYAVDPVIDVLKSLVGDVFKNLSKMMSNTRVLETFMKTAIKYGLKIAEVLSGIIEYIKEQNVFRSFVNFFKSIFSELEKGHIFSDVANWIRSFMDALSANGSTLNSFRSILSSIFKIIGSIAKVILDLVAIFTKYVWPFVNKIMSVVSKIAGTVLGKLVKLISSILEAMTNTIDFDKIFKKFAETLSAIGSKSSGINLKPLTAFFQGLSSMIIGLMDVVISLLPILGKMFEVIGAVLKWVAKMLSKLFGKGSGGIVTSLIIVGIMLLGMLTISMLTLKRSFMRLLDSMTDVMYALAANLRSKIFVNIAKSILLLAIALSLISKVNKGDLIFSTVIMGVLAGVLAAMFKVCQVLSSNTKALKGITKAISIMNKIAMSLIKISIALLLSSKALSNLASIPEDQLSQARDVIWGMMGICVALIIMSKYVNNKIVKIMKSLIGIMLAFSISLAAFALCLNMISKMNFGGLSGVLNIVGIVGGFIGLIGVLALMASKIKPKTITKMLALTLVADVLSLSFVPIAAVLMLLSTIRWSEMLVAVSGLLVTLGGIFALMKLASGLSAKSISKLATLSTLAIIFNVSLLPLTASLMMLSSIPWDGMIIAIAGLMATLLGIIAISKIMDVAGINILNLIPLAISMSLLSIAVTAMAMSLSMFETISLVSIGKGILVVAGALVVFALMAKLLSAGTIVSLMGLAVSLLIISVSMLAISTAITLFMATLVTFGDVFVEVLGNVLVGIVSLQTELTDALITLVNVLLETIDKTLPKFIKVVVNLIKAILKAIRDLFPDILETVGTLISTVLKFLRDYIGEWVTLIVDIIVNFLDALTAKLPELVDSLINFLVTFIVSSLNSLARNLGRIIEAAITFMLTAIKELGLAIKRQASRMVDTFIDFGINLIEGLWNGIVTALSRLLKGIPFIGDAISEWFRNSLMIHSPSKMTEEMGVYLMEGFSVGMEKGLPGTKDTIEDTMSDAISTLSQSIEEGVDDDLTITPVLDLSNVESGARDLNSMMNSINGANMGVSANLANVTSTGFNNSRDANQNGNIINNNTDSNDTYQVTFNVTSNNPEEFAEQVDAILQRNRLRANMAKGGA